MTAVTKLLSRFGAPPDSIIETEKSLRYADLRRSPIEAVVEQSHWPLLYVADRASVGDDGLTGLCRRLGMRDESRLLALVGPDQLALHDIASVDPVRPVRVVPTAATDAPLTIPSLGGAPPGEAPAVESVRKRIFTLLTQVTDKLARHLGETPEATEDALSLAGRALFLRFLADRQIVRETDLNEISSGGAATWPECFGTPTNAHAVSAWLTEKFNGDLLPLSSTSLQFFKRLDGAPLKELQKILHRSTADGQLEFGWAALNFAHIPVGVLSEVYEQHAWRHTPDEAGTTSAHYTPRRIAEYMVREAFATLHNPAQARVLDPAAGGGVFLIACFRQLVEEKYRLTYPQLPTRREIRSILNNQIRGFDVNPSARRLAALGLYLTALELDSKPTPLKDLSFDELEDHVLFDVRTKQERKQRELVVAGSLGPEVGAEHRGQYDLVIGNPPWTAFSDEDKPQSLIDKQRAIEETWRKTLRPIVEARLGPKDAATIALPDRTPDIPFLWRALEWAKEGAEPGHIALALPMRIFSKQSGPGRRVQDQLFRAMRVTGILNGSAVRKTEVWHGITHPWCVLFAENRRPNDRDALLLVNIPLEHERNGTGDFRADLSQAHIVAQESLVKAPDTLKVLTRGSAYDLGILRRLRERAPRTLEEIWPASHRGQGYQRKATKGNRPVEFLTGKPDLTTESQNLLTPTRLLIDPARLPEFALTIVHREGKPTMCEPPLVIVPLAVSPSGAGARVLMAKESIAFHEQYFGLSAAWYEKASDLLARWLFLILGSNLGPYRTLLTSGQVGTEREKQHTLDIKRMPFFLPDDLSVDVVHRILELSTQLLKKSTDDNWQQADKLIFEAYGLTPSDVAVMHDTLRTQATHAAVASYAQQSASSRLPDFTSELQTALSGPFKALSKDIKVTVVSADPALRWGVLRVSTSHDLTIAPPLADIFAEGESLASSIVVHADRRTPTLWVAIRNQMRYATSTQARLLAQTIIHEHEDALLGLEGT